MRSTKRPRSAVSPDHDRIRDTALAMLLPQGLPRPACSGNPPSRRASLSQADPRHPRKWVTLHVMLGRVASRSVSSASRGRSGHGSPRRRRGESAARVRSEGAARWAARSVAANRMRARTRPKSWHDQRGFGVDSLEQAMLGLCLLCERLMWERMEQFINREGRWTAIV